MKSPYLAGVNYIFTSPREFCDNCGQQDEVGQVASDTHPITPLLLDYFARTDKPPREFGAGACAALPGEELALENRLCEWPLQECIHHQYGTDLYQQHDTDDKDPRTVPGLDLGVSAKLYSDGHDVAYENYPDIVHDIIQGASASARGLMPVLSSRSERYETERIMADCTTKAKEKSS